MSSDAAASAIEYSPTVPRGFTRLAWHNRSTTTAVVSTKGTLAMRAMTRHFRSGIDEMIRQAELEEMEKKWAADNARVMAQPPVADQVPVAVQVQDGSAQHALPVPEAGAGFDPVSLPDYDPHQAQVEIDAPPVAKPAPTPDHGPAA